MTMQIFIEKVIKKLNYHHLLNWLSDTTYLKLMYWASMHKRLNLKEPKTFNEKLQWLKLNNRNSEYTRMVDKYEAKKYVADRIGEQYIIPTLGVWNQFEEINFDALPNQFVLKCTHDSGGLVICRDKKELDLNLTKEKIERSMSVNYYYNGREWPYKNVKHRILAEEYMENGKEGLHDYKIWCFNGEPEYIQYITGRIGKVTYEKFYDKNWAAQSFSYHNPILKNDVECPKELGKMLDLARKLAKDCPFLRVDFYVLNGGEIKFGELTFYPMSGFEKWHPEEMGNKLGKMLTIAQTKRVGGGSKWIRKCLLRKNFLQSMFWPSLLVA